jgi:hypothetical protein
MRITHIVLRSFIYVQVTCSVCFDARVGLLEYQQSSTTPVYCMSRFVFFKKGALTWQRQPHDFSPVDSVCSSAHVRMQHIMLHLSTHRISLIITKFRPKSHTQTTNKTSLHPNNWITETIIKLWLNMTNTPSWQSSIGTKNCKADISRCCPTRVN